MGVLAATLAFAFVSAAHAMRTGMNLACTNCHEGQNKPKVVATLSANRMEAGQAVTITVKA